MLCSMLSHDYDKLQDFLATGIRRAKKRKEKTVSFDVNELLKVLQPVMRARNEEGDIISAGGNADLN
jgi:hypothetical protein